MSLSMRARGWRSTIAPQVQARGLRGPLARPVANVNVAVTAETLQARVELLEHENLALKKQVAALRGIPLEEVQSFPDEGPATADAASPSSAASAAAAAPAPALAAVDNVLWPTPGEKFWERPVQASYSPLAGASAGNAAAVTKDARPLKVVHITAEMAPIAKVGGLGDVVTGLARSCLARGHDVTVILPFYSCLPTDQIEDLKHEFDFDVPKGKVWDGVFQGGSLRTSAYWGRIAGCPVLLLRPADWDACNLFKGGRIYGGSYNEAEAYLYFCRASLEYLKVTGQQPHVLHVHEWQACAAAMLFWDVYSGDGLWKPRIVMTIHNMDNTGECRQDEFAATGVPGEFFATEDKALDERTIGHNPERLSLMKGGLVYSNAVTTVSPTYAKEVLDGGAGGWLRNTLGRPEVRAKFVGILNGIDNVEWDPAADPLLPANYSAAQPGGKALCKRFLQRGLGLEEDDKKPIVAVVSRLVPQKGIHLIRAAIYRTLSQGGQFVLLGSGHSDGVFKQLAAGEFKDHPSVKLMIMYSEQLAHTIYGAADIVLVPSMFEPCGLTQMIALRYGAVPVVRRTGGLADTVRDVDSTPNGAGNGYTFDGTDDGSLHGALDRAIALYKHKPAEWAALSGRNMSENVGWESSAGEYVAVYNRIAQQ